MKQYIIFLTLSIVFLALSSCDKSTEPDEQPVYTDKIEAARYYYETIDSIDYQYTEIKDTFKLGDIPHPRITISKILNSNADTVEAVMLNGNNDTVYRSRALGIYARDTLNIFRMPNFRVHSQYTYTIFAYYYHEGLKTVLPPKKFVVIL